MEGYDVQAKIALLAKLAFGQDVPLDQVPCAGISKLSSVDFKMAKVKSFPVFFCFPAGEDVLIFFCRVRLSRSIEPGTSFQSKRSIVPQSIVAGYFCALSEQLSLIVSVVDARTVAFHARSLHLAHFLVTSRTCIPM